MGVGAGCVDDLRHFPDLRMDDRDVRGRDRLAVHRIDVAHRLAGIVLKASVRPRLCVVVVLHQRDVLAVRDRELGGGDPAGHPRDGRRVIGRREEAPCRNLLRGVGAVGGDRLPHRRRAREHVVRSWPEGDPVIAARVVGR